MSDGCTCVEREVYQETVRHGEVWGSWFTTMLLVPGCPVHTPPVTVVRHEDGGTAGLHRYSSSEERT